MRKCGISLGEERTYFIQEALYQFVQKTGINNFDFWGVINTQTGNYSVIRLNIDDPEKEELETQDSYEPIGTGINKYTYYVSGNITDVASWKRLPAISSVQMQQSFSIKYLFSGDLERKIINSPVFDGQEKHLLKAQLVKIDSACELTIKGLFKVRREDEEAPVNDKIFNDVDPEDEFKEPEHSFYH